MSPDASGERGPRPYHDYGTVRYQPYIQDGLVMQQQVYEGQGRIPQRIVQAPPQQSPPSLKKGTSASGRKGEEVRERHLSQSQQYPQYPPPQRRRQRTPPPLRAEAGLSNLEEENRRKIKYIQGIMPSATQYDILKCLQKNNFHVRKTIEDLVDMFTTIAASSAQSKMLVAQSMAYFNDVHKMQDSMKPTQSYFMKLEAHDIEKPQGLSGDELEKMGVLHDAVKKIHDDYAPAAFVSQMPDQIIKPSGKRKALLIGINYIGSKKELNGCCDDVQRMKRLLCSVYGFLDHPSFLTVLTDKRGTDPRLLPTRANILCAMSWLVDGATKGDVLFFHFSGHGGQKKDLSGTEIDGFDETIMPLDYKKAGHITDDEIHDTMIKRLPNGVKMIGVMDCCHSGSGMDLPFYLEGKKWKQELFPKFSEGDVQLFSSCQDSETAADLLIPSWGAGGAVTLAIVSALSQKPFAYTFASLLEQIQIFLSERKFTQRPQLSTTQKFDINRKFTFLEITANTNQLIGGKRRRRPAAAPRLLQQQYPAPGQETHKKEVSPLPGYANPLLLPKRDGTPLVSPVRRPSPLASPQRLQSPQRVNYPQTSPQGMEPSYPHRLQSPQTPQPLQFPLRLQSPHAGPPYQGPPYQGLPYQGHLGNFGANPTFHQTQQDSFRRQVSSQRASRDPRQTPTDIAQGLMQGLAGGIRKLLAGQT